MIRLAKLFVSLVLSVMALFLSISLWEWVQVTEGLARVGGGTLAFVVLWLILHTSLFDSPSFENL